MLGLHYQIARRLSVLSGFSKDVTLNLPPIHTPFNLLFRQEAVAYAILRLSIEVYVSIGILTDYPSRSPFGLPLGPD